MTGVRDVRARPAPERLSDVVRRLGSAQKSNRGAPAYSRWVNRPAGRWIAAVAHRLGLSPNQVTALSAVTTTGGIAAIAVLEPSVLVGLLVSALLVAGFALDAADGQLARLRGGGSPAGEWLDHVVDATKCATLHAAVLVAWFRWFDLPDGLLLLPVAYGIQASVFFFAIILSEQLRRSARGATSASPPDSAEPAPVLRSLVVTPADYGVLCLVFLLWGAGSAFVVAYAALLAANVGSLLWAAPRWYREMQSLGSVTRPGSAATH